MFPGCLNDDIFPRFPTFLFIWGLLYLQIQTPSGLQKLRLDPHIRLYFFAVFWTVSFALVGIHFASLCWNSSWDQLQYIYTHTRTHTGPPQTDRKSGTPGSYGGHIIKLRG